MKDCLYKKGEVSEDFSFNEQVAAVFDDMLNRSIPCYALVIDAMAHILARRLPAGAQVYDLGCSVGTTVFSLAKRLAAKRFCYTGIDSASPMLEKAKENMHKIAPQANIHFLEGDIISSPLAGAHAVLCNYTLQFIRPVVRQSFVERIYASLPPGGVFLLSEKTISHATALNRDFIAIYHAFKKSQGYSEMEIAAKREALENVLVPFSLEENCTLLRHAGFAEVEIFFTWFNFNSLVALKR